MTITVAGVPASRKTPGVNFNVVLGGSGTSAGNAPQRTIILGNMIPNAITNSSPAFSVAAGTWIVPGSPNTALEQPVFVSSPDDAATLFGRGSELSRMAAAFFAQSPAGTLYACPVADAGGTAASATLTFATTATGAFTVRLKLLGNVIDVPVASGDTVTTIAAAVCDAINDAQDLPFTAQNSSGVATITAKNTGPRGNTIVVDAYFVTSTGTEVRITTSSTASGGGTTGAWSNTAALGGEITLAAGATQDTFANALTAIDPVRFDRIVGSCIDATNIGRIVTHVNTHAGPTVQKLEQAVCGSVDTYANAVTLATGQNASRLQVVWNHASVIPAWECATQVAAARLAGDAAVYSPALPGESDNPAANLDGLQLATVLAQRVIADQPTSTEIEGALNNGLTVLAPSSARPGYATVVRSITSRSLRNGTPNYAVLDTSSVTVPDYVADFLRADLATTFAGCKLAADSANGTPPRIALVVTPSIVRSHIAQRLAEMESDGILRDVEANLSLLQVVEDSNVSGRLNCEIPAEVIPGLHIIAGNIRQL
jgi:phage tail sheath gpL-like